MPELIRKSWVSRGSLEKGQNQRGSCRTQYSKWALSMRITPPWSVITKLWTMMLPTQTSLVSIRWSTCNRSRCSRMTPSCFSSRVSPVVMTPSQSVHERARQRPRSPSCTRKRNFSRWESVRLKSITPSNLTSLRRTTAQRSIRSTFVMANSTRSSASSPNTSKRPKSRSLGRKSKSLDSTSNFSRHVSSNWWI